MKLAKAKEILKDNLYPDPPADEADFQEALKLGIEAIKRVVEQRELGDTSPEDILLGETKD